MRGRSTDRRDRVNAAWVHWLQLSACAALIFVAGTRLSRYGDIIAKRTGLGGGWIGLVLVATVTSLPELVTGVASVTVADVPDIAVGNVLGACVLNLAMIAVLDAMHRRASIFSVASQGHVLGTAFGIALLGVVAFGLLTAGGDGLGLGHVGLVSFVIVGLYALAIRTIYAYERNADSAVEQAPADGSEPTLRQAAWRYAVAAAVVVGAALALPFVARALAEAMGWSDSFVGTLLVALTTTLPELTVTVACVRIGALDLAIGNLVGSNLFNLLVLAIDDALYLPGPLLAAVSPAHALSALAACVMSAALIIALVARPQARVLNVVSWTSVAIALVYFVNAWLQFRHGG